MLKETSGPVNFTMFLNLLGEKLNGELCSGTALSKAAFRGLVLSTYKSRYYTQNSIYSSLQKPVLVIPKPCEFKHTYVPSV